MKRRVALARLFANVAVLAVIAVLAVGLGGCRRKPTPTPSAPPARPTDVLVEASVRDPAASWARVREMLGMAAWALPRTPFALLSESGRVPARVEGKLEPNSPLVAVLCAGEARPEEAFAWHVADPDRLPRIDPDRWVLAAPRDGVAWLRAREGSLPTSVPLGIAGDFFVSGAREAVVTAHVDYLLGALVPATGAETSVDVRLDVDARALPHGAQGAVVARALDALAAFGESLDRPDGGDAKGTPSAMSKAARDVDAFVRGLRAIPAGRALHVEVSLDGDRIHVVGAPERAAPFTLDVPGEVVRLWAAANIGTALSHAFDSPF